MLTSRDTGEANAFTIANQLAASSMTFAEANAVNATNASVLINNIAIMSTTNTLDAAIPGVTLTLQQQDPAKTVVVSVDRDDETSRIASTRSWRHNDLVSSRTPGTASNNGTVGPLDATACFEVCAVR